MTTQKFNEDEHVLFLFKGELVNGFIVGTKPYSLNNEPVYTVRIETTFAKQLNVVVSESQLVNPTEFLSEFLPLPEIDRQTISVSIDTSEIIDELKKQTKVLEKMLQDTQKMSEKEIDEIWNWVMNGKMTPNDAREIVTDFEYLTPFLNEYQADISEKFVSLFNEIDTNSYINNKAQSDDEQKTTGNCYYTIFPDDELEDAVHIEIDPRWRWSKEDVWELIGDLLLSVGEEDRHEEKEALNNSSNYLNDGDIFVLKTDQSLSADTMEHITKHLEERLHQIGVNAKVLVLSDGFDFNIINTNPVKLDSSNIGTLTAGKLTLADGSASLDFKNGEFKFECDQLFISNSTIKEYEPSFSDGDIVKFFHNGESYRGKIRELFSTNGHSDQYSVVSGGSYFTKREEEIELLERSADLPHEPDEAIESKDMFFKIINGPQTTKVTIDIDKINNLDDKINELANTLDQKMTELADAIPSLIKKHSKSNKRNGLQ